MGAAVPPHQQGFEKLNYNHYLARRTMQYSERVYKISECITFRKTTELFGGLSNMAAGYHVNINDVIFSSTEHLYQACRFPNHPDIQWDIYREHSPMKAKWIARANDTYTRSDWNKVRFSIMQWCLEIKLSQNWTTFGELLRSTGDKAIVEFTPKDKIWGATRHGDTYIGTNALGRLLMHVRNEFVHTNHYYRCIEPLNIPQFLLFGKPIGLVCNDYDEMETALSMDDRYELA